MSFIPPKRAQEAGCRALEFRASKPQSQRGMTPVGIARARDLCNGRAMSPETVQRMKAYFDRHQSDKEGRTWDSWGKGRQAYAAWGDEAGYRWAKRIAGRDR